MTSWKYLINPAGGTYSFDTLKRKFSQNFAFLSSVTGFEFEIEQTDIPAGSIVTGSKIIGFQPKEYFSNSSVLAVAKRGCVFNSDTTAHLSREDLRRVGLHELGHNLRLRHTESPYSIMTNRMFRKIADWSLLWREDIIKLYSDNHLNSAPVGWCTADEDRSVMIPALWWGGEQWCVKLRNQKDNIFVVESAHAAEDGIIMVEKASIIGDELHLEDGSFLGITFPLVRFKFIAGNALELIGDGG